MLYQRTAESCMFYTPADGEVLFTIDKVIEVEVLIEDLSYGRPVLIPYWRQRNNNIEEKTIACGPIIKSEVPVQWWGLVVGTLVWMMRCYSPACYLYSLL